MSYFLFLKIGDLTRSGGYNKQTNKHDRLTMFLLYLWVKLGASFCILVLLNVYYKLLFAAARGDELKSGVWRDYRNKSENHDRQHFLQTKSALLHALGNAGHAHSRHHIIAHAHVDHMQHTEIRHTAVKALRKYSCHEVRHFNAMIQMIFLS